jgi:hypothetical protein
MKGRKCHVRGRRYAEDPECHVADVDSIPQAAESAAALAA